MKRLIPLIVLAFIISGCSTSARASTEEPIQAAYSTPVSGPSQSTIADPVLNSIEISLSAGPHGLKYSCDDCHASLQPEARKKLIWFNEVSGNSESVATATELCTKCHPDQSVPDVVVGPQIHAGLVCTDCHNAHSTQAGCATCHMDIQATISAQIDLPAGHTGTGDPNITYMCGGSACHEQARIVASKPIYHQPIHRSVPCQVCHDASKLTITGGGDQPWATVDADGKPVGSHQIGLAVDCARCHFAGNPWGLMEVVPADDP